MKARLFIGFKMMRLNAVSQNAVSAWHDRTEGREAPLGEAGDSWTWTALDSDSKLIVSYRVSSHRDGEAALHFTGAAVTELSGALQPVSTRAVLTTELSWPHGYTVGIGTVLMAITAAFKGSGTTLGGRK